MALHEKWKKPTSILFLVTFVVFGAVIVGFIGWGAFGFWGAVGGGILGAILGFIAWLSDVFT